MIFPALRQNLLLKTISLVTAVFLYVFVQGERNPVTTRPLVANVKAINVGNDLEIVPEQSQIEVSVNGPRAIIERIKDSDVIANLDFKDVKGGDTKTALLHVTLLLSNLPDDMRQQVVLDSPVKLMKVQVFTQSTRKMEVEARFSKEAPAGYRYDSPQIRPRTVTLSGRADVLAMVKKVIVNASPKELGASIEGNFEVSLRDANDRPVDGIQTDPSTVHISLRLQEEPFKRIVPVSARFAELPQLPYQLDRYSVVPNEVKVSGRPAQLNPSLLLNTEDIRLRNITESQTLVMNLVIPPGIMVTDLEDQPIRTVKVTVIIRKNLLPTSPSNSTATPSGERVQTPPTP